MSIKQRGEWSMGRLRLILDSAWLFDSRDIEVHVKNTLIMVESTGCF